MDKTLEVRLKPLMLAALNGDQTQYYALLEQLTLWARPRCRALLARYGQDNAEGEDLVQEFLLTLHLKRHTWRKQELLLPWAATILRHKVIDYLRKYKKNIHVSLENEAIFALAMTQDQPPNAQEWACADIERHLGMLPSPQQDILRAILSEGLTHAQIAARLHLSENFVRVSLHRGIKKLAHHLHSSPI